MLHLIFFSSFHQSHLPSMALKQIRNRIEGFSVTHDDIDIDLM